jgi:hypothetical protein
MRSGGEATCQPLPGGGHDYSLCPFTPAFEQKILALDASITASDFVLLCQCNTGITTSDWTALVTPTGGTVTALAHRLPEIGGGVTNSSTIVLTIVVINSQLLVDDITWDGKPLVAF